jgi:hypothetical protein
VRDHRQEFVLHAAGLLGLLARAALGLGRLLGAATRLQ